MAQAYSHIPPQAMVYMDGDFIGLTNKDELKILGGTHHMHFVRRKQACSKTMTFIPGNNPSIVAFVPCEK